MDRMVDGVFDEWSGGVHQGPGECDEVRRGADIQKVRKEVGRQGKWKGMKGNGQDDMGNDGDTQEYLSNDGEFPTTVLCVCQVKGLISNMTLVEKCWPRASIYLDITRFKFGFNSTEVTYHKSKIELLYALLSGKMDTMDKSIS